MYWLVLLILAAVMGILASLVAGFIQSNEEDPLEVGSISMDMVLVTGALVKLVINLT